MKRLILFAAIGLLLSLTFIAPALASEEHPTQSQIHVHFGAFWIPGVKSYVEYPPPVYVIPPHTVIVLPPVLAVDALRSHHHHHHIHHDPHWTHSHKYRTHRHHSKPHRQFREITIHPMR
jgi:hypothetical protein